MVRTVARWSLAGVVAAAAVLALAMPANPTCDPVRLFLEADVASCCEHGAPQELTHGDCCPKMARQDTTAAGDGTSRRLQAPLVMMMAVWPSAPRLPLAQQPVARRAYERPPPLASPIDRYDVLRN